MEHNDMYLLTQAEATKTNNPYKAEATTVPWLGTALSCILRVQGSQAAAAAVGLPSEVLTEGSTIASRNWIIDSGATDHISSSPFNFQRQTNYPLPPVLLPSGATADIVTKGSLPLNSCYYLHDDLATRRMIGLGKQRNGLYYLVKIATKNSMVQPTPPSHQTVCNLTISSTDLWHKRLGHISPKNLTHLISAHPHTAHFTPAPTLHLSRTALRLFQPSPTAPCHHPSHHRPPLLPNLLPYYILTPVVRNPPTPTLHHHVPITSHPYPVTFLGHLNHHHHQFKFVAPAATLLRQPNSKIMSALLFPPTNHPLGSPVPPKVLVFP
uniref:GAG-pre-integrase domain-containing protein n=1 Tax=Populus alba TaxID=43335 RepID=A0A4U5Q0K0_POPAL|nr:hypothetical protein D5086_0000155150 [Populus alba]